jgi:6-phosphogluconolactonase
LVHELVVLPDADAVAAAAAARVAAEARAAVADHGRFTFAVSGGRTPWAMLAALRRQDVAWDDVVLYQVDERVAPAGDPDRNLTHLLDAFAGVAVVVTRMPVEDGDLDAAAARYAALLPNRFDLVHLGLGPDGHTASLVPGDPVLEVADHLVAPTRPYQGRRRMTLTYPALNRAATVLWLVTGADKRDALKRLLAGDPTIPAGRVEAGRSIVMADAAAAGQR